MYRREFPLNNKDDIFYHLSFLVFDMGDKITSSDEAYACTTTKNEVGPVGRSILSV